MFSVLMSVYFRETPDALATALGSLADQTLAPAEVLLVKDGPLPPELERVIAAFEQRLPLRVLALPSNRGLAVALNAGLAEASQPWIMRFDSDDYCLPFRVERQAARAASGTVELFGAQIEEFETDPRLPRRLRRVPCEPDGILRFGRRRNPFNHMTVCFRREVALALGGYPQIPLMEDYALWMTMLARGVRAENSAEVLVRARIGNGMIARRGGAAYARSYFQMQDLLVDLGLKGRAAGWVDAIAGAAASLAPDRLRSALYGRFLRRTDDAGLG